MTLINLTQDSLLPKLVGSHSWKPKPPVSGPPGPGLKARCPRTWKVIKNMVNDFAPHGPLGRWDPKLHNSTEIPKHKLLVKFLGYLPGGPVGEILYMGLRNHVVDGRTRIEDVFPIEDGDIPASYVTRGVPMKPYFFPWDIFSTTWPHSNFTQKPLSYWLFFWMEKKNKSS